MTRLWRDASPRNRFALVLLPIAGALAVVGAVWAITEHDWVQLATSAGTLVIGVLLALSVLSGIRGRSRP